MNQIIDFIIDALTGFSIGLFLVCVCIILVLLVSLLIQIVVKVWREILGRPHIEDKYGTVRLKAPPETDAEDELREDWRP